MTDDGLVPRLPFPSTSITRKTPAVFVIAIPPDSPQSEDGKWEFEVDAGINQEEHCIALCDLSRLQETVETLIDQWADDLTVEVTVQPRPGLSPEQYRHIGKTLAAWETESEQHTVDPDSLAALQAGVLPGCESGDDPAVTCSIEWPCDVLNVDLVSSNLRDAIGSELLVADVKHSSPTFDSEPVASR